MVFSVFASCFACCVFQWLQFSVDGPETCPWLKGWQIFPDGKGVFGTPELAWEISDMLGFREKITLRMLFVISKLLAMVLIIRAVR